MRFTITLAGIAALLSNVNASPIAAAAPEAPSDMAPRVDLTNDWGCKSDKNPVIALHGLLRNRNSDLHVLEDWLRARGYCTFGLTYGVHSLLPRRGGVRSVAESSREIVDLINEVLEKTGATKVDIVGHSEGGFQALYASKMHKMSAKIDKIVAIAPPSHGTDVSKLIGLAEQLGILPEVEKLLKVVGCPACIDLSTGDAVKLLNDGPIVQPGNNVTVLASRYDTIVTPAGKTSFINESGVANVLVQDVCPFDIAGHISMAVDPNLFELTLNALRGENGKHFTCKLLSGWPIKK